MIEIDEIKCSHGTVIVDPDNPEVECSECAMDFARNHWEEVRPSGHE